MNVQSVSYFPSFLCFSGSAWDECEKSYFPLDIRSDWFLKSYLFQNFLVEVKKKKTCELWSQKENLSLQSFGFHDWPSIHGKEQSFSISASFPWHLAEIISKDTVRPLIFVLNFQILINSKYYRLGILRSLWLYRKFYCFKNLNQPHMLSTG